MAFNWSEDQVKLLIAVRNEKQGLFTGKRGTAQVGWDNVAEEINVGATPKQCKRKWENMVQKYKDIVTAPTGISTEDKPPSTEWVHFDAMHEFMGSRYNINPPFLVDTGFDTNVIEPVENQFLPPPTVLYDPPPSVAEELPLPPPEEFADVSLTESLPTLGHSNNKRESRFLNATDSFNNATTSSGRHSDTLPHSGPSPKSNKSKRMKRSNENDMTINDLAKLLQEQERAAEDRHREFMTLLQKLLGRKKNNES